jgi:Uma2 family endonuclease
MSTALISIDDWLREGQRIAIPAGAFTLDGFNRWYLSGEVPDDVRVSYIEGDLHIEHLLPDGMVVVPREAATSEGFLEWAARPDFPRRGRITFIDKEIHLDMSPEEIETHNKIKTETNRVVATINLKEKRGQYYSDGVLIHIPEIPLTTEPDGTFVTWRTLKSGRVKLIRRRHRDREYTQVTGTPDWLLEVISRSSFKDDAEVYRDAYHRARVPEYWLVNALAAEIDFRILLYRRKGYIQAPAKGGWQYSPLFERWFRLTRRLADMDLWEYVLRTKK